MEKRSRSHAGATGGLLRKGRARSSTIPAVLAPVDAVLAPTASSREFRWLPRRRCPFEGRRRDRGWIAGCSLLPVTFHVTPIEHHPERDQQEGPAHVRSPEAQLRRQNDRTEHQE